MNKLPPSLLYLVIYNPTLKPPESAHPDDEDAEEQAHVLFYTGNNHAVSKDRVLRQVGLAKAMANFTTIFAPQATCESIHSQSRRMVMLSPEPDFWIHACFELETTLRVSRKDEKGKGKQKEPAYDHNEASLHDTALRTRLLLGYEAFKVTHGSFTSILKKLSKEALELQLERFFTVWAWSWDLGKQVSFLDYLGIRVHPLSNQLVPLVDVLEDKLPPHYFPLVLISSCIITSKPTPLQCPPALIWHLLRILESRPAPLQQATTTCNTPNGDFPSQVSAASSFPVNDPKHTRASNKTFLGVPAFNMNVNMDVRKWNWPGYLNFGIGGSPSSPKSQMISSVGTVKEKSRLESAHGVQARRNDNYSDKPEISQVGSELPVDSQALEDALSSEAGPQVTAAPERDEAVTTVMPPETSKYITPSGHESVASNSDSQILNSSLDLHAQNDPPLGTSAFEHHSMSGVDQTLPKLPLSHSFSELHVHLSDSDPLDTHCRLVRYLCMDNILFALVPSPERKDDILDAMACHDLAERSIELIDRLREIVSSEQEKIASAFSSSPVQIVLQKSQHVVTTSNQLTYSSSLFSATSWHLHEGKRALGLDPDLLEIYSRGQSPQDWHLVKRGLGANMQGEVYMEIERKEASLVDVDGEIMGVLRRFSE